MAEKKSKIIVTGAAGLVGQNLVPLLADQGFSHITAIDKDIEKLSILKTRNPTISVVHEDVSIRGDWESSFADGSCLIQLQAQIKGKTRDVFEKNTIRTTELVLEAARSNRIPYIIHVSSSVVNSLAYDDYVDTKKRQEGLVIASGIDYCILRPTLMFGPFDSKHLGWLSGFMERFPLFPIPGNGRYIRQPLYVRDFCRVVISCLIHRPKGKIYDIVGRERIDYIEIIRMIKRVRGLRTLIVPIPYGMFYTLLRVYAPFSGNPPFTADQLKALIAGDDFTGVDLQETFGIRPTPLEAAVRETFGGKDYPTVAQGSH